MSRPRSLLTKAFFCLPLVAAAMPLVTGLIEDTATRHAVYRYEVTLLKVLGAIGGFYACSAFRKGDYLRRAWWLFGFGYMMLVAVGLVFPRNSAGELPFSAPVMILRGTMILSANVTGVVAMWMMARAWSYAGLEHEASRFTRRALDGLFMAAALAVVGPSMWCDFRDLLAGDLAAYGSLASDVGDLVGLALIAPLLRTAIALRGGLLVWPWLFLTAGEVCWLLYDATGAIFPALHIQSGGAMRPEEMFRTMACVFCFMGGIAQRRVTGGSRLEASGERADPPGSPSLRPEA